ncbi:MAG: 23S rRNA (guanosine(2251)-2'-O)-methyltransferase RlmB [Maioricimonas sp. JB049]
MSELILRNPHSVLAAIRTRPRDVQEVRINQRTANDAWKGVASAAQAAGVAVRAFGGRPGTAKRGGRGGGHEGRASAAEASVREREDILLEPLFAGAKDRPGVWVALDQLQDPHNLGAIFRTAAFFGVRGIVLTKDRSAPLSATAYDVASGGVEHVPFSLQANLSRAIEEAKTSGLWVLGTSEHAEQDLASVDRERSWLLVIGNEERGLRRLTLENCDEICRLSPRGDVTSLNASVAAGICIAGLSGAM